MRLFIAASVALMLGASPVIAGPHVRYLVRSETNARGTHGERAEVSRPAKVVDLRIVEVSLHTISLHPRVQPSQPRIKLRKYEAPAAPPATRIEFQSHQDDEPGAFASLSSAFYNTMPSATTPHVRLMSSPQLIKSADGRLLGFGVTGRF